MSNYHIRNVNYEEGSIIKTVNAVFHIPIPIGNNVIGKPWRDALVAYLGGADAITSILPEVRLTTEESDMKIGAILEKPVTIRFTSATLTDVQRLAQVTATFTAEKVKELAVKQIELKYFGKEGDII